jgi:hypothetical protein
MLADLKCFRARAQYCDSLQRGLRNPFGKGESTNMKKMKNQAVTKIALTTVLGALALGSAFGQLSSNATVFATGLNNPRGLKFGPTATFMLPKGALAGRTRLLAAANKPPG